MKEPQNSSKFQHRRSRQENREITRAKIINMGRKHFLTKGYAGTTLEQVAEEAGFSRGALYANFRGKEELFLAVFDSELHMHIARYHEILDSDTPVTKRAGALRAAFLDHVTDKAWGILRTEFELGALRSETLRKRFVQVHRRDLESALELAQKAVDAGDLLLNVPMDEFVLATQSFMMGFAIKQRLLAGDLSDKKLLAIADTFFNCYLSSRLRKGSTARGTKAPKSS